MIYSQYSLDFKQNRKRLNNQINTWTYSVVAFLGSGAVWPKPLVLCFPEGNLAASQLAIRSSLQSPRAT